MTVLAGIDVGSRAIKVALLSASDLEIVACAVSDQGVRQNALAMETLGRALERGGLRRSDVRGIVATGYGRNLIEAADSTVTEITCHARGVRHLVPDVATVVDIGGQDSKLLRIGAKGTVRDFEMNDRCAAGTGRFLEMVAARLDVRLEDLGELACRSRNPATISSMCAVFAETEIVGLLASGVSPADIVAGVQVSICRRIAGMAGRAIDEPVVFTGGVAMVPGFDAALSAEAGEGGADFAAAADDRGDWGGALPALAADKETWRRGDKE